MTKSIFLFSGEQSGDLHEAKLLAALKAEHPSALFWGVAGPQSREVGMECILPMEQFEVMGFGDVMLALPRLIKQFYTLKNAILKENPDAVLLIDSPDFTLRLAKAIKKGGYRGKVIQYVCPTIWAWRKGRMKTMVKYLDLLLPIYPFEEKLFAHTKLQTHYVSNPVAEKIATHAYQQEQLYTQGLKENAPILALFPGSRKGEIGQNFPCQLAAAKTMLKQNPSWQLAISLAKPSLSPLIDSFVKAEGINASLIPTHLSYELMQKADLAIATSGTVTLELALHSCPTVVTYALTLSNYLIGKYLLRIRLPHYCIVNILANKMLFPEFIDRKISPEKICHALSQLTSNRKQIASECYTLKQELQMSAPAKAAANIISSSLSQCIPN